MGVHQVFVTRPDTSSCGSLSVELLATFNRARTVGGSACILTPSGSAPSALLALTPETVRVVSPRGAGALAPRARWWAANAAHIVADRFARARTAFWTEWHRELRRHAGDERLPPELRLRLRESAKRALARSAAAAQPAAILPRRALRERLSVSLVPSLLAEASALASAAGIRPDQPLVTIEVRRRPDAFLPAIDWLLARGYFVVRIGDAVDRITHGGIVELPRETSGDLLEVYLLLASRFVVCESIDIQQSACLTGTPSLLLNATDPFSGYPVRQDGLFTLRTAIDLDSGEVLTPRGMVGEDYFRNRRNYGYRDNRAPEVLASIREMHEGISAGWDETPAQSRFRHLVIEAGDVLAPRVPLVAQWGPDAGFIGDGRLARWQAEQADHAS